MKEKAMALLKSPSTYVILVLGMVLAIAYRNKLPGVITTAASKLPGASA